MQKPLEIESELVEEVLVQSDGQAHPGVYTRVRAQIMFEIAGIALAGLLVGFLCWRMFDGVQTTWELEGGEAARLLLLVIAGAVFSGYLLADLGSGVVHFIFDRFFSIDTPVMGKNFVYPFRLHHSDPKHITRHDFIETNGNNCLATCPFLITLAIIPFDYSVGWHVFLVGLFVFASIGTFATNQFHKWAHVASPPRWVAWLQEKHLILPRDHHQIHHTYPYNTHYCITTGWLNSLLLKISFWSFLEWCFQRIGRLAIYTEPTPWEQVPGSPAFKEREEMSRLR